MLLVICNIIGKIHLFQLRNLNHTFSPTYLYIYHINHLREKSHQAQRPFCVCVFFGKISYLRKNIIAGQLSCVPFKTFSENSHWHYLTSDISILSFNLFKKIFLASQSQSKPNGQKGFFTLFESFFYRSKKYSQRLYFSYVMLINICKAQTLFKCCSLMYLENFIFIHLRSFIHDQEYEEQRVGEKTKCRRSIIGETESNKLFIKSFMQIYTVITWGILGPFGQRYTDFGHI